MSLEILTNNLEVDNNALEDSREAIYDEHVQVEKFVPEKRVYR